MERISANSLTAAVLLQRRRIGLSFSAPAGLPDGTVSTPAHATTVSELLRFVADVIATRNNFSVTIHFLSKPVAFVRHTQTRPAKCSACRSLLWRRRPLRRSPRPRSRTPPVHPRSLSQSPRKSLRDTPGPVETALLAPLTSQGSFTPYGRLGFGKGTAEAGGSVDPDEPILSRRPLHRHRSPDAALAGRQGPGYTTQPDPSRLSEAVLGGAGAGLIHGRVLVLE